MGKLRNYKSESAAVSRVDFGLVAATCFFFFILCAFCFCFYLCCFNSALPSTPPLPPPVRPRLLVWLRLPFWLVFIFVGVGRQIDFMSETS